MKTLSSDTLLEIAKEHGTEHVILAEIEWEENGTRIYATKEILGIKGKIDDIGVIETISTSDNRQTQSLSLTLDDIDDEIKDILNRIDVHKIICTIYQLYTNLTINDKFVLFKGQISAPFTWGENDRSVQFEILSEIESFEVGFSPEEGQLDFVSKDFIGQAWPLCFGSVVHIPAQKVHQTLTGVLLEDIGIVDPSLQWKLDRLEHNYADAAVLIRFYQALMKGADQLSPPVDQLIEEYITLIKEIHNLIETINTLENTLDNAKSLYKKHPTSKVLKNVVKNTETQLDPLAKQSNQIALLKEQFENIKIELAEYEFELKKQAANGEINAYNQLRAVLAEKIAIIQEICRQSKFVKECFLIQNGELFPQNTTTEISINNLKFRGIFTGEKFCIEVGPYAKYKNLQLTNWVPNDDECEPDDENNGLSVFYLKEYVNLVGMYLYVKKKGEDDFRHIIKVNRQEGLKVIFELIEWDRQSGQPDGISLESLLDQLIDFTETGNLSIDLYMRPEFQKLQQLIATNFPNGISINDARNLFKLLLLEPSDKLSNELLFLDPTARTIYTIIGEDIEFIQEAAGVPLKSWFEEEQFNIFIEEVPDSFQWHADTGSIVRDKDDDCQIYICNILPSEIHAVYAYRTIQSTGKRILTQVPSSYYEKNESANLGTINVTCLIFKKGLSEIEGEGWEDQVYVTMTSSIGPNICDIIQHLIETYTVGTTVNAANFAAVKANFGDKYPANFPLFDRPNVLDEIARIAWEARCGLYQVGSEFFIRYLSEEPTEDLTFTLADIETETLQVTHTSSEELTTRLIATFNRNHLPIEEGKRLPEQVYRHNVKKYGLHSRTEYFHIYNIDELVEKSATFWLIRQANTWKKVTFKTVLKNIRLDVFDCVKFDNIPDYFADSSIKTVVENSTYDPKTKTITVVAWVPVRSGEMTEYYWAWPSQKDENADFPTVVEIEKGFGGGYGPGKGVQGTIPGC